mmetsp:Transcript_90672/g.282393  ORF Transcript_90672/g.282393 Transcript_90672/m.282393 type:complete len:202 (-) Transcript_90672:231-836(-)
MESWSPCHQHVSDNSERPHVGLCCVRLGKDFWGNIVDRPTCLGHPRAWVRELSQPKIDKLEKTGRFVVIQEVLQLQVAVRYVLSMQISNCQQHLIQGVSSRALRVPPLTCKPVVKLAPLHEFHDQVDCLLCFVDHVQVRNMGVVQLQIELHLVLHVLLVSQGEPAFLEALHCILPAVGLPLGQAHGAVHAGAKDCLVSSNV